MAAPKGHPRWGGRKTNAAMKTAQELARPYTEEAMQRLGEIMRTADPSAATRAAIALLERAWGRPEQTIHATVTEKPAATNAETLQDKLTSALAGRSSQKPTGRTIQ